MRRHRPIALALSVALLVGAPALASAQEITCDNTAEFPCGYELRDLRVQQVPPVFRYQARVAQTKLPGGEGAFRQIRVNLLRDNDVLCTEILRDVEVRAGVLNLEIGRAMSCELAEVMAENKGLRFQICLGTSAQGCLDPIALSTVPYAARASFAVTATDADTAHLAGQAHYAHRASADRALFFRPFDARDVSSIRLGYGYFDFQTPLPSHTAAVFDDPSLDDATRARLGTGGFVQWTPVHHRAAASAQSLHFAARSATGPEIRALDELHFAAERAGVRGALEVVAVSDDQGLAIGAGGLHVAGWGRVVGALAVRDELSVAAAGAVVQAGASTVEGEAVVSGALTASHGLLASTGGLLINNGDLQISGASRVEGSLAGGRDLAVAAALRSDGVVDVGGGLLLRDADGSGRRVLSATGAAEALALGPAAGGIRSLLVRTNLVVEGRATIQGRVTLRDPTVVFGGGACTVPGTAQLAQGGSFVCADVDECVEGQHDCHANATCTNRAPADGRFACTCRPGFIGDGVTACAPARRLFVTSERVGLAALTAGGGDGLRAADRKCQALADAEALGGRWVAWLSTSGGDASQRVIGGAALVLVGTAAEVVADNLAGLLDGSLDRPIDRDERGQPVGHTELVLTGTQADGGRVRFDRGRAVSPLERSCRDWRSASAAERVVVGTVGAFDSGAWTHTPVDAQCDGAYRLYCVER